MPTYTDFVLEARDKANEISVAELKAMLDRGDDFELIDIREHSEVVQGIIPGARIIGRGVLDRDIESHVPDRDREIVLYCAGGHRSALSALDLARLGYRNVKSIDTGFGGWKDAGHDWVIEKQLSQEQQVRYSRHFLLPEVGERGQKKLLDSRVLMIGAGGLGSPAAYYLAAAGIGHIGIIDDDVVDISNLQRQILHTNDRVGVPKVDSAEQTLTALNPDINITKYQTRISSENIMEILADGYDIIVDGCDNFPTRYLINDACVFQGIPNVHGSIFRFEGQVTVFDPTRGPCYRCLYPEPPPPGMAPSCAEAGVLGVLPGIIGSIQAMETIKMLLDIGDPLIGRMVQYDALRMEFREFKLRKDSKCLVCSDEPEITELIDYEHFCTMPATAHP